jgi:hypothetical protein
MRFTLRFRQDEKLFTSGQLYLVDQFNTTTPDQDPLGLLYDFSPGSTNNPGIYLGDDEIQLIRGMYPYIPNFLIVPGEDGTLAFRRNGRLGSISVSVEVESDMEMGDIFSGF